MACRRTSLPIQLRCPYRSKRRHGRFIQNSSASACIGFENYHEGGKQKKLYLGKTDAPERALAAKRAKISHLKGDQSVS